MSIECAKALLEMRMIFSVGLFFSAVHFFFLAWAGFAALKDSSRWSTFGSAAALLLITIPCTIFSVSSLVYPTASACKEASP